MRITRIKLSGFKSFVDPTTLTLPGNLTGVVGPNGCGKSNIIDALIWVMGESSAKQLRGETMTDVIFNGSSSRKPVGQTSVEIIFDNSDGTLGGRYAGYGEFSIKRSLARDGVSKYQLNGTPCRRKDVTDVFLGTGLGSRGAYSVIEQGMISRVVEARPEELRGFLEEAAGISKYKERRRETEHRIRHAKENIERLNDIRDEITTQLSHLQRQAKAAERYQTLKQDERLTDAQLLALRWREIDRTRSDQARTLATVQNNVEAAVTELRSIEATQTIKRDQQTQAIEAFNQVQSDFYATSAEISRLEQTLQHAAERRNSLDQDLARARRDLDDVNGLLASDQAAITGIDIEIRTLQPDFEHHEKMVDTATQALQQAEDQAQVWSREWDGFNHERAEAARLEHVEQVRLEHLSAGISGARARIDRLHAEHRGASTGELEATSNHLRDELLRAEQAHDVLLVKRDSVKSALHEARNRTYHHRDELHELRTELETLRGKESSLSALQDAALRPDQGELRGWLQDLNLDNGSLLAEQIDIDDGWEMAVEMALRVPLSAICHDNSIAQVLNADISALPAVRATFIDRVADVPSTEPPHGMTLLSGKLRSSWPVANLLAGVYTAETVAEATRVVPLLAAHESVITAEGYWLGPDWIQVRGRVEEEPGILQRERVLEELRAHSGSVAAAIEKVHDAVDEAQLEVGNSEEREIDIDLKLQDAARLTTELKTELARQETSLERRRERAATISDEIGSLEKQSLDEESAATAALSSLRDIRAGLAILESKNETMVTSRATIQEQLDQARLRWREARESRHEIALKLESHQSSRKSLAVAALRNQQRSQELVGRGTDLEAAIISAAQPQNDLHGQLELALAERVDSENRLAAARQTLETLEHEIRQHNEAIMGAERLVEERRQVLDDARLEERALHVRLQELDTRLGQSDFEIKILLDDLDADANEETWQASLDRIRARIDRLGPINLAAIDEFSQLSERKEYLDRQLGDLTTALDTLEAAIRKIDRETRTRFKETFDKVNVGLQTMFPVLFGGGHAYLELTGEDMLETGVTVMARPPGKRNSTIHLLSGGEKALTALAFVFSLFELNPAPFCLLDEVDAPLDDANVVRLCEMLKSMSQRIQFICVTHNKITMEIAEQLIGVTMQEPGVSRLVSVNMEEAVEMAAAS